MYNNDLTKSTSPTYDEPMTIPQGKLKAGRRPNRRSEASRKHVLDVVLRLLASGGPGRSASNSSAKKQTSRGAQSSTSSATRRIPGRPMLVILDTVGPSVWGRRSAGFGRNAGRRSHRSALERVRLAVQRSGDESAHRARRRLHRVEPETIVLPKQFDAPEDAWSRSSPELLDGIMVELRHARRSQCVAAAAFANCTPSDPPVAFNIDDALDGLREATTLP